MDSVIRKLYSGDTFACEDPTPKTREYQTAARKYYGGMEDFTEALAALSPELSSQFARLETLLVSLHAEEEESRFVQGFCMGAQLMLTVLAQRHDRYDSR